MSAYHSPESSFNFLPERYDYSSYNASPCLRNLSTVSCQNRIDDKAYILIPK